MPERGFPTDEMSLRLLIEACELNPETGQTHLQDFLNMGTRIKSETLIEDGEGLTPFDAPVYLVEYEEDAAPWSEQQVIQALAREVLRLRKAHDAADAVADLAAEYARPFTRLGDALVKYREATQGESKGKGLNDG